MSSTRQGPTSLRLALSAAAVMFLWAICFPLIRVGLSASPPLFFAGLRGLIAGAVLLLLAGIAGRPMPTGLNVWGGIVLIGLTATTLGFFGMFYAGSLVSPGIATVVANIQPLIAAVLAYLVLRERLGPVAQMGLVFGFGGIVLMTLPSLAAPDNGAFSLGLSYLVLAAVGIAVSYVVMKRMSGRVDVWMAMGWQLVLGSLPLLAVAPYFEDPAEIAWTRSFIVVLVVLALAGTAWPFAWWFSLLQRTQLTRLNVYTFLTPIFGLLLGAIFFSERFQLLEFLGIAVSLFGVYLVNRRTPAESVGAPGKPPADVWPVHRRDGGPHGKSR